jgi:hypothetical protein
MEEKLNIWQGQRVRVTFGSILPILKEPHPPHHQIQQWHGICD